MARFQTPQFQIELPDGYVDSSTYAFVLPRYTTLPPHLASFKPSVVVKFDPQSPPIQLVKYVVNQRTALREKVVDLEILNEETGSRDGLETMTTTFEWGQKGATRLRQKQYFLSLPAKASVCCMTGTDLVATFDESEVLFDRIFASLAVWG